MKVNLGNHVMNLQHYPHELATVVFANSNENIRENLKLMMHYQSFKSRITAKKKHMLRLRVNIFQTLT